MSEKTTNRACWCGHPALEDYSPLYRVCRACGTLVSRAPYAAAIYDKDYWLGRQTERHGLPDIRARARLDLPERCTHWLRRLVSVRPPPARVLEVGCAHGGFVALLGWAGYEAMGTEMSPWVSRFAHETFGVKVLTGLIEEQDLKAGSFDVIVLNDVIEHLPDPIGTMGHCARLLAEGGLFLIQTPEYKEHIDYQTLVRANDLFIKHMDKKNDEHIYLYSRRSSGQLFGRLGFGHLDFSNPMFPYDMTFAAGRAPIAMQDDASVSRALEMRPVGRLVQALLDKAYESNDRWWAMQRLEAKLNPPAS
jgi:SAM-dependent methyltransferase